MEKIKDRVSSFDKRVFATINKYWAKAIKIVRAKDFLAEILGTFVLVVRMTACKLIVSVYACMNATACIC